MSFRIVDDDEADEDTMDDCSNDEDDAEDEEEEFLCAFSLLLRNGRILDSSWPS